MSFSKLLGVSVVALLYFDSVLANDRKLKLPDFVKCERNNVTSWQGQVSDYYRQEGNIKLTITTNYGTEESLALHFNSEKELEQLFRLNGQAFSTKDWTRLEKQNGALNDTAQITVWVCEDNLTPPIFDWKTTQ